MITITVRASKNYSVIVGTDLLSKAGIYLADTKKSGKVAIISDSNVWPLYGKTVADSLLVAGFQPVCHVFPAGESSKNANTYLEILNFLAENKLTRSDCVVALGGGVVGDITGFTAATYLRGISYVQIPTTLLAMVDSSVGGKTAIDLPAGKNLVGAFYQPDLVLCDIAALYTLPAEVFRDGCAEVIKYGVLYDEELFAHLAEYGLNFDREKVITRCIQLKREVVADDEFDTGARQKLNLGHTIGHAVESLSQFSITHGQAVAIGMSIVASTACSKALCSADTKALIKNTVAQFQLPISTDFTANQLYHAALSDKKRFGGTVNLIVPKAIGECMIMPVPVAELESFIQAGL